MSMVIRPDYNAFILSIVTESAHLNFDTNTALSYLSDQRNKRHPLVPIICQLLADYGKIELSENLRTIIYQTVARNVLIREAEKHIFYIAQQNGISLFPYKGAVLAEVHPYPDLRPQADIDIMIEKDQAELIHKLLVQNQYKPCWGNHYHLQYFKKPFYYEIHTRLVSYKYELFFGLERYGLIKKMATPYLTNEDYIIISCLQAFDDMSRVVPFADLYQLVAKINLSNWQNIVQFTDAAFLLHFCHIRMENRYGFSPLSLIPLPAITAKVQKSIKKAALKAKAPNDAYWAVLVTVKRPIFKLFRTVFPHIDIIKPPMHEVNGNCPSVKLFIRHMRRTIRQLFGYKSPPEGQELFRQ